MAARVRGLLQKEKEKRDRLKELGIEYDFPGYKACVDGFKVKPSGKKERKASADEPKLEVVGKKVDIPEPKKEKKVDPNKLKHY